jgi:hypothetical protein
MSIREVFKVNSPNIVSETIDGETVIVNLQTGDYYSLLRTATDIWSRIEQGTDRQSLINDMMQNYSSDLAEDDISKAVNQFIEALIKEGLIILEEEEKSAYQPPTLKTLPVPLETPQFELPEIEKFTDMEDLLLLDPIHEADEETGWPNAKDAVA